jgi:hypothetical protein
MTDITNITEYRGVGVPRCHLVGPDTIPPGLAAPATGGGWCATCREPYRVAVTRRGTTTTISTRPHDDVATVVTRGATMTQYVNGRTLWWDHPD